MKTKLIKLTAVFCIGLAAILSAQAQPIPQNIMDKWYSPDTTHRIGEYKEFSPQISFRVRPVRLPNAIEELASVKIKPLSNHNANDYIGNRINTTNKFKPYLVRGLYFHDGTGGFILKKRGNDLLVLHSCLGDFSPMKRQPLVVLLDWKPKNVYVQAEVIG